MAGASRRPCGLRMTLAVAKSMRASWRAREARVASAYRSPAAEHTPAEHTPVPLPVSLRLREARLASAFTSPGAAPPVTPPPPRADDLAASPALQHASSPSAHSFSSPADPLRRTLELGQLEEMAKSPALTADQLCDLCEEESERAVANELVVLAAMDPESLGLSNGIVAGWR